LSFFDVNIDTEGDPYLDALVNHGYAIEYFGALIVDSVQTTFACDEWAQYDVRGIECGHNQRAWTNQLFHWIGEKYSAVSAIEDALTDQFDPEVIEAEFIADVAYDAQVFGWEGWWMQQ